MAKSITYFPLVGLTFGLILVGLNLLLQSSASQLMLNFILIAALVFMDRGLHLDGLADTADGLFGGKNKEDALRIMKDSSVGAFGIMAIVLVFLGQFVLLGSIKPQYRIAALIFMPTIARYSVVLANSFFEPAKTDGLAISFRNNGVWPPILATLLMLIISAILIYRQPLTIMPIAITAGIMLILPLLLTRKTRGVTGDIFGALIEINQLSTLAFFTILK